MINYRYMKLYYLHVDVHVYDTKNFQSFYCLYLLNELLHKPIRINIGAFNYDVYAIISFISLFGSSLNNTNLLCSSDVNIFITWYKNCFCWKYFVRIKNIHCTMIQNSFQSLGFFLRGKIIIQIDIFQKKISFSMKTV